MKRIICPYCNSKKIMKNWRINYNYKMCNSCKRKSNVFNSTSKAVDRALGIKVR